MLFKKKEDDVKINVTLVDDAKEDVVVEEKEKLGIKGICGIILGLFFIMSGIVYFESIPFQSILIFIAGLSFIPSINKGLKKTFGLNSSMYDFFKTLFIFIAFAVFFMGIPAEDNIEVSSDNVIENKVVEKIVYTTDDGLLNNTINEKKLLENVVLEKDSKISELENTILNRDMKISELENTISNTTAKMEELKDEISNKTEKVTELEKKLSSASTSKSTSTTTKKSTTLTSTTSSTSTNN